MDDDLFTYEVEIPELANIPCDLNEENDLEQWMTHGSDDDLEYDLSNVEFTESLEDGDLKDKSLRNKAFMKGIINEDDESSMKVGEVADDYEEDNSDREERDYDNEQDNDERHELCDDSTQDPQVVFAAKLPILNPNEFDLWKMRIEQYFLMTDYLLWEVILNGDSPAPTRVIEGVLQPVAPTTIEQSTTEPVSAVTSVSAASAKIPVSALPNVDTMEGAARIWYEKEPPNSILTWDDLVNKFFNQFFPPSKTTQLKNEISRFTQRFEETIGEAWERFKEMLRACPHHGFSEDSAIKTNNRIDKLADQILNFVEIVNKKVITPAIAKVASTSDTLPSNTVPNPKGEMKVVTTCSGLAYEGPSIPTNSLLEKVVEPDTKETMDKEHSNCKGSTAHNLPLVVPISFLEPNVLNIQPKPNIPYPSRLNDQKLCEKATNQIEKFFQIFHYMYFDISFANALLLMPKFGYTIKSLLTNKDKLFELAKVPLNENCSDLLLKKLPEKLGDPGKSITHPKGVAEDVFVKVGKFHFPTDFVVVDFEADPRVPLILGGSFLRTDHVIDIACEEFVQDVLDFQYNSKSSNPTLVSNPSISKNESCKEPIVKSSSPTLTPFGESDFFLEEIEDFLNDESIPMGIENSLPMTHLLENETPFVFSKDCIDAFNTLKKKLTEAPILVMPDWNLPFELMCDASDFAIGAVLGQRKTKHFQPIHYASNTMTEDQIHYTTTEKEMLVVVYAFEKFRPYLVLSKSIVYTDHSALKYLLNKQDAKPRLLRWVLLLSENPHKDVLEKKEIIENFPLETLGSLSSGSTPWFADIANFHAGNLMGRTMNYQPVTASNQSNRSACVQEQFNAKKAGEEIIQQYVLFPVWSFGSTNPQNIDGDAAFEVKEPKFEGRKPESKVHVSPSSNAQNKKHDDKTKKESKGKSPIESLIGYRNLSAKFEDFFDNNINEVNAAGISVPAVGQFFTDSTNTFSAAGPSNVVVKLEDITYSNDEEDVGAEANFTNLETSITVSPIRTTRVHKDHPVTQIIGDLSSATQTRSMTSMAKDQGFEDLVYPDKVSKVVKAFIGYIKLLELDLCKAFEKLMKDRFQISLMGELTFFLGLHVKQKPDGIFISQDKYVAQILRKFCLTNEKSASTPINTKKPLIKDPDDEDVDVHTYRSMIGSLMYLNSSRPDIMFTVSTGARFQVIPKVSHLHAVKRIFRYLKGKPHLGLWYPKDSPFNLVAYSDSDYAGAILNRKSTTGGCQFLGCSFVRNTGSLTKFYMYPRFLQLMIRAQVGDLSLHSTKYTSPALTQKVFANMRRVGKGFSKADTPLFEGSASVADDDVHTVVNEPSKPSPTPPTQSPPPSQDIPSTSQKLKMMNKLKVFKLRRLKKVGTPQRIETSDDTVMDDVLSMQDGESKLAKLQEVVEVVTTVKLITEVVTTASVTITADAKIHAGTITDAAPTFTTTPSASRKRKGDEVIDQVKRKEKEDNVVMRYQALKRKPQTEAQVRKNMMIYLKNMAGFKMDYFRGMSYDGILPIFEKKKKTIVQNDDDVYTEATPLALKVPVVDYEIYTKHNKPYYKIKRADGSYQLYLSFLTRYTRSNMEKSKKCSWLSEERKYPLTRFTLDQILNNVRLEVEEDSEEMICIIINADCKPIRFPWSIKGSLQHSLRIGDLNITIEEYIRLEEEKSRRCRKVFNWKTAKYAIVYNDAQMSKSNLLTEPILNPQHIDEFDLNNETSLSKYNEEVQNNLYFNDIFPFNVTPPDVLKSEKDNEYNDIDIIKTLEVNEITHGSNVLSETSHNKITKTFRTRSFVTELNVNIMLWTCYANGMLFYLIMNLYASFGILFDPKRYYKDGDCAIMLRRPRYEGLEYSDADSTDFEERIRMEHSDDVDVVVFICRAWGRLFDTRGPLVRELILEFFSTLRFREVLLDLDAPSTIQFQTSPSYTLIRDPLLRLCQRMMAHSIAGRSQAPEKEVCSWEEEWGHIYGGQFVARLAEQFGLLTMEILGGLTIIPTNLLIIYMGELVKLSLEAARDAPADGQGGQADLAPMQREVIDTMAEDFSRFTIWAAERITWLLDSTRVISAPYSEAYIPYQRHVKHRTNEASTSAAQ
nr:uncharacterized mitochondrial protein AtMg00810-like [Tanacetum cinerariifolium]